MSSASDFPSAGLLAELEKLRAEPDPVRRGARAWQIVIQASNLKDHYVITDFAIEHGLVASGDTSRSVSWRNPTDELEMIWIPPGSCYLGEKTPRQAALPGFSLARHPVTNAQFQHFLAASGYTPAEGHPDPSLFLHHWRDGKIAKGQASHPVVHVSYLDALAYCRWAGLTLPTEWLWEKAARGGDGRRYPWGDRCPAKLAQIRGGTTCAVGSFAHVRSPYGCEDLVGNVSEWCQMTPDDQADVAPPAAPEAAIPENGEPTYAAVRGSCFLRKVFWRMVSARRRRLSITRRNRWVGFRPACLLPCRPGGGPT